MRRTTKARALMQLTSQFVYWLINSISYAMVASFTSSLSAYCLLKAIKLR